MAPSLSRAIGRRAVVCLASAIALTGGACCFGGGRGAGLAGRWNAYEHPTRSTAIQTTLVLEGSDATGTFELVQVATHTHGSELRAELHGDYRLSSGTLYLLEGFSSFDGYGSTPPTNDDVQGILDRVRGPVVIHANELELEGLTLRREAF